MDEKIVWKKFDSLSGVGIIVGLQTGKVLFAGVRNKFCALCNAADRKGIEPSKHKCYKNFDRNASSTKMESDAIAEGFTKSIEMHGLIFRTMSGDNDSNVYKTICDNKPYQDHHVIVQKIECSNHLLRNMCNKLKTVSETVQPKGSRSREFIASRKVIETKILNIRREIVKAAGKRREENLPEHGKSAQLKKDILIITNHVFGEHKDCYGQGFDCGEGHSDKNYVPELKLHGLYQKVENIMQQMSNYADSLLLNLTNNPAEWVNSFICKAVGGKRVNFCARGSNNARIAAAVVQHNSQQVVTEMHKNVGRTVPPIVACVEKRRQVKVAQNKELRALNGRANNHRFHLGTDKHYGPQSEKPDLSVEDFERLRKHKLEKLNENARNWEEIELKTRSQNDSEYWKTLRQEMLTSSHFGAVCRMRSSTSCAGNVKNILFPPPIDTLAMRYGRENEGTAREELSKILDEKIEVCGLFIDQENHYLGASPDGLINHDGLVEIKCPATAEMVTAEEAINTIPVVKNIFDRKDVSKMNRIHKYFYQVQGQLHITRRQYCIFAVWTPQSMKIVRNEKDDGFWKQNMEPYLTRFYTECMLPEIIDSRHTETWKSEIRLI